MATPQSLQNHSLSMHKIMMISTVILSCILAGNVSSAFVPMSRGRSIFAQLGYRKVSTSKPMIRRQHSSSTSLYMMDAPEMIECDVAIIGGGPAGMTCALYTSRAALKTVVLDKNPSVGALAITSHIANYPGVDRSMRGEELLDQMRIQAVEYGTDYRRAQVFMIDVDSPDSDEIYTKTVYTPDAIVKARTLVLATGAMGRSSKPFDGEEEFLGRGVSYCATCDGAFYKDAPVAVKGSCLEAIEEAMYLTKFASTVHWITPLTIKKDDEHVQQLLAEPNVQHWPATRLKKVVGDVSGVTGVEVQEKEEEHTTIIPCEGAFIYAAGGGNTPITDFIGSKVDFKEEGGVLTNDDMETSVKGIFAIGDIRNTPYKQVVVAAADGCIAAMSIEKYLKGRKSIKVDWIHK